MQPGSRSRRLPATKDAPPQLPITGLDFQVEAAIRAEALGQLYGGLGFELYDGGLVIDSALLEVARQSQVPETTGTAPLRQKQSP